MAAAGQNSPKSSGHSSASSPHIVEPLHVDQLPWTRLILGVFAAAAVWGLTTLPLWSIQDVQVRGNQRVPADDIMALARIASGQNLIWLSTHQVGARILKDPRMASVSVEKKLPSLVVLAVKERDPFAVLIINNRSYAIDRQGNILFRLDADPAPGSSGTSDLMAASELPVVRGYLPPLDSPTQIDSHMARDIETTLTSIMPLVKGQTLQVERNANGDMTLLIGDVLSVLIGSPDNMKEKIRVLQRILKDVGGSLNKVAYVDVRLPAFPVLKWRS